ncbi:hypothetical protein PFISCL1PPCAC_23394, partial [Pristionchus fissidentatus]
LHLLDGDIHILILVASSLERPRVHSAERAASEFVADVDVLVDEVVVGSLHRSLQEPPRNVAVFGRLALIVLDQRHQRSPIDAVADRPQAVLVVDA